MASSRHVKPFSGFAAAGAAPDRPGRPAPAPGQRLGRADATTAVGLTADRTDPGRPRPGAIVGSEPFDLATVERVVRGWFPRPWRRHEAELLEHQEPVEHQVEGDAPAVAEAEHLD